jgi:hypothetical protein
MGVGQYAGQRTALRLQRDRDHGAGRLDLDVPRVGVPALIGAAVQDDGGLAVGEHPVLQAPLGNGQRELPGGAALELFQSWHRRSELGLGLALAQQHQVGVLRAQPGREAEGRLDHSLARRARDQRLEHVVQQ